MSEEAAGAVGALLRRLHDATASFVPPAGVIWQPCWLRDLTARSGSSGIATPARGTSSRPRAVLTAFIDWECAGPVDRWWEVAAAVWLNAQLHDDDVAERNQLPDAATRARHVRAMFDGYGVPRRSRPALLDRLVEVAIHAARAEAIDGGVTPENDAGVTDDGYPLLWAIAWRVRSASWIARHRGLLERHACAVP